MPSTVWPIHLGCGCGPQPRTCAESAFLTVQAQGELVTWAGGPEGEQVSMLQPTLPASPFHSLCFFWLRKEQEGTGRAERLTTQVKFDGNSCGWVSWKKTKAEVLGSLLWRGDNAHKGVPTASMKAQDQKGPSEKPSLKQRRGACAPRPSGSRAGLPCRATPRHCMETLAISLSSPQSWELDARTLVLNGHHLAWHRRRQNLQALMGITLQLLQKAQSPQNL